MLNSPRFTVKPGARYEFSVSARVAPKSAGSGYFALIFLKDDKETARVRLPIEAATVPAGSATTAEDGSWLLDLSSFAGDAAPGEYRLRASYAGSEWYWPSRADVIWRAKRAE